MSEDTDIETVPAADTGDAKKLRRKRGTGFPVMPLSEAARILREAGKYGFEHPTPAFASYMGHSTTNSGAFRQRLSAFRDWGLITGRGEMLTMTDVARQIAIPTDTATERRAMQESFNNCDVFARLYGQSAKGQALSPRHLGGRAVLDLGVTSSSSGKFIDSFIESAVAAELAELNDDGEVVLWGPENGAAFETATVEMLDQPPPSPDASPPRGHAAEPTTAAPTVRQLWPIDGGEIVFELRSDQALPAVAFTAIGEVVAKLETLASSLRSEASTASPEDEIES